MKKNVNKNSFKDEKLNNNLTKKKDDKKNIFKKIEMKTSKNLADISKNSFNISNTPYITYSQRINISNIKNPNKNTKTLKNIILNNDENGSSYENATNYTYHNLKKNKSSNLNKSSLNASNNIKIQVKSNKKVNFKKDFTTIIEVESFKRYNVNNYLRNNNNCINCSCLLI